MKAARRKSGVMARWLDGRKTWRNRRTAMYGRCKEEAKCSERGSRRRELESEKGRSGRGSERATSRSGSGNEGQVYSGDLDANERFEALFDIRHDFIKHSSNVQTLYIELYSRPLSRPPLSLSGACRPGRVTPQCCLRGRASTPYSPGQDLPTYRARARACVCVFCRALRRRHDIQ